MKLMELYQNKIMGAISGLDRIRFRGTLRWLANATGINSFLGCQGILLKNFTQWAKNITADIRAGCDNRAGEYGIETIYLNSSGINKEELARKIAAERGITAGAICNFSVLETCYAPKVKGNKAKKQLELKILPTKCVHVYHYFHHREFGFGHVRLQTWAPYNIFICLNGRHWLERQLQKKNIAYTKDGNCFPWIEDSPSIMKYFGKRNVSLSGRFKSRPPQEVMTDYRKFYEGIRIKHWVNRNSVKMYNKSGSILRIETTINYPRDFKVFRHPDDDESREASWQKMRKGVNDLHRRCEVSDKCNKRYADSLAMAQVQEKLKEVVSPACNKVKKKGKSYRGINPWQKEDYQLLTFLAKGENALSGFRNKDLRDWLYPESKNLSKPEQKRYSGRTTRRIKLLRVHGLVKKVAKENRYTLTAKGQKFAVGLMNASAVDIKGLTEMAA